MPDRNDIVIRLHLTGGGSSIDSKLLVEALDIVEASLYASDRSDVERAARELQLSTVVRDASLERLRHHRHQRLLIEGARSGSIEIVAVVAGVSLYVIEKTIGEAFSDGMRASETYAALREFFRRQVDEKALYVSEALRRSFGTRRRQVTVRSDRESNELPHVISIETGAEPRRRAERPVRSLSQELEGKGA